MLKKFILLILLFLSNFLYSDSNNNTKDIKFIFGSCSNQNKIMPHWQHINSYNPDYLILLGDNVYGDFNDSQASNLANAYNKLDQNKYFLKIREKIKILSIWDDHDYGVNDGDKNWIYKDKAKSLFLDFFNINENDDRRKREGLYYSWNILNNIKIKIIALDTRYFKDKFSINRDRSLKIKYVPDYNNKKTILGDVQWKWFLEQINSDYDLLLVLSSIQILPTNHGWEKWFNFPHERERLINLLKNSERPTIILSGDRHLGGIYKLNDKIYEITSSSFNQSVYNSEEVDKLSIGEVVTANNFGLMEINTEEKKLKVQLRTGFYGEKKVFSQIDINF